MEIDVKQRFTPVLELSVRIMELLILIQSSVFVQKGSLEPNVKKVSVMLRKSKIMS